jgi:hypothetical protein
MPQGRVQLHAREPCSTVPPREPEPGLHALCKEDSKGTRPLVCEQACCSVNEHLAVALQLVCVASTCRCYALQFSRTQVVTWCCLVHMPLGCLLTEDSQTRILRGEECSGSSYMAWYLAAPV